MTECYTKAIKLLCGAFIVNKCRFVHVVVWNILDSPQTRNHITKLKEKKLLKWLVANISCMASCMFWRTVAVQPQHVSGRVWLFGFRRRSGSVSVVVAWSTHALRLIVGCSKFRHILKLTNESGRWLSQVQAKWIQAKVTLQDLSGLQWCSWGIGCQWRGVAEVSAVTRYGEHSSPANMSAISGVFAYLKNMTTLNKGTWL